ncbi:MAG: hypothetical protein JSW60_07180 [Thermoplasmatales archaeon]|nr:MAG: hypothetical protein JSW60_07180 [Thermoplasmatales archaeon]
MKKIIVPCICLMLVMTITPLVTSEEIENEFEKKDFKFDVFHSIRFVRKNGKILTAIFQSWNPLWQIFLKHLDIVSFSIFEDTNDQEFLHAKMKIRDFRYSERRTCYAIYWTHDGTRYFVGTNTHTEGENVSSTAGYFGEDNTAHSTPVNGEINEEGSTLTWVIPKDIIGNPEAGDQLVEIHANTYLIYQKDCEARIKLYLANDRANPPRNECYTYVIQY